VIPNQDKDTLLLPLLDQDATPSHDLEPLARRPVPGLRMRTRAFIKVQDGCDHHCTFCLTTLARGPARSIPLKTVLQRIDQAQAGGAQEIVLSGVSLSAYGKDLGPGMTLSTLIEAILKNSNIPRLRLSSIEPWGLPAGFFALWQDPRLCRQLHLPLQSGCAATLRRMARPIRPREYAQLVAQARSAIPDLALSTDLIVGFPGESEAEFSQNLAFVQEIGFSDAHIFRFSLRPGTAATRLPGRVPGDIARNRAQRLSEVIDQSKAAYHRRFLGREVEVLWESAAVLGPDGWQIQGLSNHSLRVHTIADQSHWNRLSMVRIETRRDDGDLQGQLISKC
jgi:threonylcarbamoyladenosine tRNA methylthiotransferase MtaB